MERVALGPQATAGVPSETHGEAGDAFERALPLLYRILGIEVENGVAS
jgi:hypothetical protein